MKRNHGPGEANGAAGAFGHPPLATGARLLTESMYAMQRRAVQIDPPTHERRSKRTGNPRLTTVG